MSASALLRRWNVRVLRRELRQHSVIFLLVGAAVALSVGALVAAHNLVEPPESDYGAAQFAATVDTSPDPLAAALDRDGHAYGTIASATTTVSGTAQRVAIRVVDQSNPVTAPLVRLREGRWPASQNEVAVTDRAILDGSVGDRITIGAAQVDIVGIVENPTRLDDEFVLALRLDPFDASAATVQFLIDADPSEVSFSDVPNVNVSTTDGPTARGAVTLVTSVVAGFGFLQVGLLAGSGFAVIARRRRRQFGLLAAAGATPAQLRAAARGPGLVLGASAAACGTVVGGLVSVLLVPRMEGAVGHRIDVTVPWLALAGVVVVAVAVTTASSAWPSRRLATASVAELLAAERPRAEPVGRAGVGGAVIAVVGAAALAIGFAQLNVMAALLGVLLAPIGLVLVAPLLVRLLAGAVSKGPIPLRLAGRLVGRSNRRSAAVVAALALSLAVPTGIVVVTSSLDARRADDGPNVAQNWFIAWQPGADDQTSRIPADAETDQLWAAADRLGDAVSLVDVVPIEVAVWQGTPREVWDFDAAGQLPSVEPVLAARPGSDDCFACDTYGFGDGDGTGDTVWVIEHEAWIATPALTAALGVESPIAGAVAVAEADDLRPVSVAGVLGAEVTLSTMWPNHARVPGLLLSESVTADGTFERVPIGVLAVTEGPLDADQRAAIRRSIGPELVVEFHEPPPTRGTLRASALTVGVALGLAIALAATSLLIVELDRDRAVLRVVGAPPNTSRRLASAVAGIVALAGAGLALVIGYVALVPLLSAKGADFPFVVPVAELAVLLVLFPVLGAGVGWLTRPRSPGADLSST